MSNPAYERTTQRLIELLKTGTVPWKQAWHSRTGPPKNGVSKKPYRGLNVFILSVTAYTSPWWFSPRQANELGMYIRKGEKVSWISFWMRYVPKQKDPDDDPIDSLFEEPEDDRVRLVSRFYRVVNLAQLAGDGVQAFREKHPEDTPPLRPHNPTAACEAVLTNMPDPPEIRFGLYNPSYNFRDDVISMPKPETFTSAEEYYGTLYHELCHSVGHPRRLNRRGADTSVPFGTPAYSREELVAEMGAALLCAETGIDTPTIANQAAYLKGWANALSDDPKAVFTAAAQAQKTADFILGRSQPWRQAA